MIFMHLLALITLEVFQCGPKGEDDDAGHPPNDAPSTVKDAVKGASAIKDAETVAATENAKAMSNKAVDNKITNIVKIATDENENKMISATKAVEEACKVDDDNGDDDYVDADYTIIKQEFHSQKNGTKKVRINTKIASKKIRTMKPRKMDQLCCICSILNAILIVLYLITLLFLFINICCDLDA